MGNRVIRGGIVEEDTSQETMEKLHSFNLKRGSSEPRDFNGIINALSQNSNRKNKNFDSSLGRTKKALYVQEKVQGKF